jgi:hypothetical protein
LKVIRFLKRVGFGATPRQKQAQTLPLTSEVRKAKAHDRDACIVVLCTVQAPLRAWSGRRDFFCANGFRAALGASPQE